MSDNRSIQETINELEELRHSPDICYACYDNPMCDSCVLSDAIKHLEDYQRLGFTHIVEVVIEGERYQMCSECYHKVNFADSYCNNCGRKIDWDHEAEDE